MKANHNLLISLRVIYSAVPNISKSKNESKSQLHRDYMSELYGCA